MNNINNTSQSLTDREIIKLKDCISFVLDKDDSLGCDDVMSLWKLNMRLVSLMEDYYHA